MLALSNATNKSGVLRERESRNDSATCFLFFFSFSWLLGVQGCLSLHVSETLVLGMLALGASNPN